MLVADDHEVANDYAGDHYLDFEPALFHRAELPPTAPLRALAAAAPLRALDGRQRITRLALWHVVNLIMLDGVSTARCKRATTARSCCRAPRCTRRAHDARRPAGAVVERRTRRESPPVGRCSASKTLFAHVDESPDNERRYWADNWNGYPTARARLVDFLAEPQSPAIRDPERDIHAFLVNDVNTRAGEPTPASSRPSS